MPDSITASGPSSWWQSCFFPLVAIAALEYFKSPVAGALAGTLGIAAMMYAAWWIDRIPLLACKIPALIGRKKTPDA